MDEGESGRAAGDARSIEVWLIDQGLRDAPASELFGGCCERLLAGGVPLSRAHMSLTTLHPQFGAYGCTWLRHKGLVDREGYEHGAEALPRWQESPFYFMISTETMVLRRRLEGDNAELDFPILKEFRDQGATDYLAQAVRFGQDGALGERLEGGIFSWTSDRPGGFGDGDVARIGALIPTLSLALKVAAIRTVADSTLAVYLGEDAGRRVLRGEIQRGSAEIVRAILWLCDLRGFTAMADTTPVAELVSLLNEFFDCLADPLEARGGQVLKFLGDSFLATFDLAGRAAAEVAAEALAGARGARTNVADLNRRRAGSGLAPVAFGLALHQGEVMYGNIGAAHRLDFTVIGPAVNEVSRIERLCRPLERDLLVSAEFAAAAGPDARLVSLGRHELRGVREPRELFTLADDEGGASPWR